MTVQYINHSQLPRILRVNWIASSIKKDITIPTCLIGSVGVGKTSAAKQFGRYIDKKLKDSGGDGCRTILFHASMIESTDIGGFPHIVTGVDTKTGNEGRKVEYAMMEMLPFDSTEPALIIFDEIDRAPIDVQNACTELLTGGSIHGHKLSPNAYIIATMNGVSDMYTNELSKAVTNRMDHIYVTSDSSENLAAWTSWAVESDIDDRIVGFAHHERDLIKQDLDFEETAFPTSRSRDCLSSILKAMDAIKVSTGDDSADIKLPIFAGLFGTSAALNFMAYLKYFTNIPPFQDIFDNPEKLVDHGITQDTAKLTAFISSALQNIKSDDMAVKSLAMCKYFPQEMVLWFVTVLEAKFPNIITSDEYKGVKNEQC